jgi:hypothetical protein
MWPVSRNTKNRTRSAFPGVVLATILQKGDRAYMLTTTLVGLFGGLVLGLCLERITHLLRQPQHGPNK